MLMLTAAAGSSAITGKTPPGSVPFPGRRRPAACFFVLRCGRSVLLKVVLTSPPHTYFACGQHHVFSRE